MLQLRVLHKSSSLHASVWNRYGIPPPCSCFSGCLDFSSAIHAPVSYRRRSLTSPLHRPPPKAAAEQTVCVKQKSEMGLKVTFDAEAQIQLPLHLLVSFSPPAGSTETLGVTVVTHVFVHRSADKCLVPGGQRQLMSLDPGVCLCRPCSECKPHVGWQQHRTGPRRPPVPGAPSVELS